MDICIFQRIEKKYRISRCQMELLRNAVEAHLIPDIHGKNTVCSLYLDTPDHLLIRNSIDAKVYKEKLRLRSYGTPGMDSRVFLEIKKKFQGVVYKRRVSMTLAEAMRYLEQGEQPVKSQIMSEINYAMQFYHLPKPAMLIACEREAFFVKDLPNVRLTFDSAVRYRDNDLRLEQGSAGKIILPEDTCLLEIKTDGAMPLWLSHALDQLGIRPVPFSKYGAAYLDSLRNSQPSTEGVMKHVYNF